MGFMREWDKNKKDWEPKLKKLQQFTKEKLNLYFYSYKNHSRRKAPF